MNWINERMNGGLAERVGTIERGCSNAPGCVYRSSSLLARLSDVVCGWLASWIKGVGRTRQSSPSNYRAEGVRESRMRDPREEIDRVLRFPRFNSGLVCQESKAYKEGTVRTKALLVAGRPKEGSARLGVLGVGVKAFVLKWDRQGPDQTKTAARQTG